MPHHFPITTLAVDDEKLARSLLHSLVQKDPELVWVGESRTGSGALTDIARLQPDLVLLDIHLPILNGIEVAQRLSQTENPPYVIFVTAFDDYAIRAFELNAIDYLLKPIEKRRFALAVERAKRAIRHDQVFDLTNRLLALTNKTLPIANASTAPHETILVTRNEEVLQLQLNDVVWVAAANQYVVIHSTRGEFILTKTLSHFLDTYGGTHIVRVHRSAAVNTQHLSKVKKRTNGTHLLTLSNGDELTLARARRDLVPTLLRLAQP